MLSLWEKDVFINYDLIIVGGGLMGSIFLFININKIIKILYYIFYFDYF